MRYKPKFNQTLRKYRLSFLTMYTCVTCGLQFEDSNAQKSHMKSDWHRYNLKRRVAQLPPIDEQTFDLKIAAVTNNDNPIDENNQKISKRDLRRQKKAGLEARKQELLAARDALQSKMSSSGTTETTEMQPLTNNDVEIETKGAVDEFEPNSENWSEDSVIAQKLSNKTDIPATTCLFCPVKSHRTFDTIDENVEHMFKAHGLYIPERKYLNDLAGLLIYLGEKIGLGNCCLSCSYQGKNTEAVREHMLRKRHMRIPYEDETEKLELSDFYDFTSSYNDTTAVSQNDDDWEDLSGEEVSDDEDNSDEEDTDAQYQNDSHYLESDTSLHLASGAVIGHRLLARYYRQNLKPERILTEGQGTVTAAETRLFIKSKDQLAFAQTKRIWNQEKKSEDRNDRRAQKFINNQPHFRDPLLQ